MSLTPAQLPGLIIAEEAIIYNTVAASMFIFWEHCITFNEEEVAARFENFQLSLNSLHRTAWILFIFFGAVHYRSKWNLVSLLCFVIRYMTLAIRVVELVFYTNVSGLIHPSLSQCIAWLRFEAASGQILFFSVEIVLIMRVFAFYGRNKLLLAGLITFFVCESCARIVILGITIPKIVIIPSPLSPNLHLGACLVEQVPALFSNYWVPGLIFESILFMLVAARFIQTKLHAEIDSPDVLIVFVRDGAWAFTLIFGVLLWSTLSFELTPVKGDVALTWLYSVLGVCGSRLILNLRGAAAERTALTDDEGLEFALQKGSNLGTAMTSGAGYTTGMESEL